jgi:hypothetical protein
MASKKKPAPDYKKMFDEVSTAIKAAEVGGYIGDMIHTANVCQNYLGYDAGAAPLPFRPKEDTVWFKYNRDEVAAALTLLALEIAGRDSETSFSLTKKYSESLKNPKFVAAIAERFPEMNERRIKALVRNDANRAGLRLVGS